MRPVLYDFIRALKSRGVLASMSFMIIFSLAIIPFVLSAGGGGLRPGVGFQYSTYDAPDGYHVLFYAYNHFGQPLSGIQFNVTVNEASPSISKTASTNSSGFALLTIPYPGGDTNSSFQATITSQGPGVIFGGSFVLRPTPAGMPEPPGGFGVVTDAKNSSRTQVIVFAVGPYFSLPDYSLYYQVSSGVGPIPPSANESSMTFLANISSYVYLVNVPVPANASPADSVVLSMFDKNGTVLSLFDTTVGSFTQQRGSINATSLAQSFLSGILGFFVPLMAVLGAYTVYGRDRVTGILESVLVRPVTRSGLLTSRYIAAVGGVGVAVFVTVLLIGLIIWIDTTQVLSTDFLLASTGALVVEVAAFVGLMFIISQFTKSTGALIGAGIGVFMVLDFLWNLLLFLALTAAGATFGSLTALHLQVDLSFLNPAQFLNLVQILQTNSISGIPVQPAAYGVTVPSVVLAGLIWILLPVFVALRLVSRRD
jgi:ABC-2 type transport system permease protein